MVTGLTHPSVPCFFLFIYLFLRLESKRGEEKWSWCWHLDVLVSLILLSQCVFINLSNAVHILVFPTRAQLERNRTGSAKAYRIVLCSGIVEGPKAPETLSVNHKRPVWALMRENTKRWIFTVRAQRAQSILRFAGFCYLLCCRLKPPDILCL